MDKMREYVVPETEESGSSCDDNTRQLVPRPQSHFVNQRDGNDRVKILVIRADDEQTLYTFNNVTRNSTLQDLLKEITQTHKIHFHEGTKFYMESNTVLEFDYIVHMGNESRSKHREDVVDSDEEASIRFAVKKRRRLRILSYPEERCNSPKPTAKISDITIKKEAIDQPEFSSGRKAKKRRSTESEASTQNGGFSLPSHNRVKIKVELDESTVTDTNSGPADALAVVNKCETEQIPGTDLGHTNPSTSTSEPTLSYNEVIEGGGVLSEIQNVQSSPTPGRHAYLSCQMIIIGSYAFVPDGSVIISQEGVRFSGPHIKDDTIKVPLQIKLEYIVQLAINSRQPLPILIFWVRSAAGNEIRDSLGMHDVKGLWFHPGSHDPTRRLIIIMPKSINEKSEKILKALFPKKKILVEMPIEEASTLLLQSAPERILRNMKDLVKAIKVNTPTIEDAFAVGHQVSYKKSTTFIKTEKTMSEDRKNGMKDEVAFKKPKNLEIKVENNSSIVDEQEETDEFLLTESIPTPMKRPKLNETETEKLISQWRQDALDLVATLDNVSLPVDDLGKETVKKNSSPSKRATKNRSLVDDTKNRKTKEPVKKIPNLSRKELEKYKISVKRFGQNTPTVENIENKEAEMLLEKPRSPLKRYRSTLSNEENDTSDNTQIVLVYPPPPAKGGISITNADISCLRERSFLNDLIIDFYLKYLTLEVLSEADRSRTYIFSIHFYKRLTSSNTSSSTKRSHQPAISHIAPALVSRRHERVKNWTKNVNIFEKDFIVVPINKDAHWFVAIICFPNLVSNENVSQVVNDENGVERSSYRRRKAREMAMKSTPKSDGITEVKKHPCILVFDSLASAESHYKPIISTLRDYLTCEHELRVGGGKIFSEETIRGACPKVPQQYNFSDCGIYVLQYVESFFTNPIKNYQLPIETLKDWFDQKTASSKRQDIVKLLRNIRDSQL